MGGLIELKRKFPSLGVKDSEDEELLHYKGWVQKRPRTDSTSTYTLYPDLLAKVLLMEQQGVHWQQHVAWSRGHVLHTGEMNMKRLREGSLYWGWILALVSVLFDKC
jgi:hypothetical protein